jgi:hypothetical protein
MTFTKAIPPLRADQPARQCDPVAARSTALDHNSRVRFGQVRSQPGHRHRVDAPEPLHGKMAIHRTPLDAMLRFYGYRPSNPEKLL